MAVAAALWLVPLTPGSLWTPLIGHLPPLASGLMMVSAPVLFFNIPAICGWLYRPRQARATSQAAGDAAGADGQRLDA